MTVTLDTVHCLGRMLKTTKIGRLQLFKFLSVIRFLNAQLSDIAISLTQRTDGEQKMYTKFLWGGGGCLKTNEMIV
jgi:hypothetical protein